MATDPEKLEVVGALESQGGERISGYSEILSPVSGGFCLLVRPLTQLTCKNTRWKWDAITQQTFELLKDQLTSTLILSCPDSTLPYILDTDASQQVVRGVLAQIQNIHERVIAYFSKTLSATKKNYCVTWKKLLAVAKAIKHFHPYLY